MSSLANTKPGTSFFRRGNRIRAGFWQIPTGSFFEDYTFPLCKKTEERNWPWMVSRLKVKTQASQSLVLVVYWTNQFLRVWKLRQRMRQESNTRSEWNRYLLKHKLESIPLGFEELCRKYTIKTTLPIVVPYPLLVVLCTPRRTDCTCCDALLHQCTYESVLSCRW